MDSTFSSATDMSEPLACPLSEAAGTVQLTVERSGSAVLLQAAGEIDLFNVGTWRRLLAAVAAVTAAPGALVVDTGGLQFMAWCAFAVLAEQSACCRRRGVALYLVSRKSVVGRIVAAGRLQVELPCYRTVHGALVAHRDARQASTRSLPAYESASAPLWPAHSTPGG